MSTAGDAGIDQQEERTAAQPADHAAGASATTSPRSGSGRSSTPTRDRDAFEKMFERDKDELRSARRPDRGRQHRPALRRRARLPHLARRLRAARDPPGARRGRRRRAGRPGLAARRARLGHLRRGAQAEGRRASRSTAGPRRRPAPARADEPLRRVLGRLPARQAVEFDYRVPATHHEPLKRHLQPWGVVRHPGRWYVVGHDTDRGDERLFRLSRVVGDVRRDGTPGGVRRARRRRPARDHQPTGAGARGVVEARCWSARARPSLRRRAARIEDDVAGPTTDALGPGRGDFRDGSRRRAARLRSRRVVRAPGRAARRVVVRLRRPGAGVRHRTQQPALPRDQSPACWLWCPTSTAPRRCASTSGGAPLGSARAVGNDLRCCSCAACPAGYPTTSSTSTWTHSRTRRG